MKQLKLLLVAILFLSIMVGCSFENKDTSAKQNELSATISITKNHQDEVIDEKTITFKQGDKLLDVMKNHFEINDSAGYITSIEGIEAKQEDKMAWMYTVNDEMVSIGASDYELKANDKVNWDLQSWE